ncbi:hypothetical protein T4B_1818 [Trichinella pseudospiralis]|uniref:Uncharacterized protein n=1 Tax=Trichinella pseudospiralis TaxID=6337 RepID=A0A0V1IN21_TRIPS|nr:hypothetical protein T4B_1818 [Trichinella pseudospiralis]
MHEVVSKQQCTSKKMLFDACTLLEPTRVPSMYLIVRTAFTPEFHRGTLARLGWYNEPLHSKWHTSMNA